MDDDEFDDGIADEDFLEALKPQTGTSDGSKLSALSSSGINEKSQSLAQRSSTPFCIELEDLPSDAFSSSDSESAFAPTKEALNPRRFAPAPHQGLSRTSSGSFRQTTLWGGELKDHDAPRQSQQAGPKVYRADLPREEPSHHRLDREALKTWVYPTNLGAIRDYQFSIVKNSLFNNTLVALPTGLGKTFIAATVMLNFYRWTTSAKIVFVAPTKPLVAQQVDACYRIVGIPRSDTTLLTGDIAPGLRVDEWEKRRVFFMTPQTLLNDISHGYADPKSIALLVIDEAHRAVGEYAYSKVAKLIRRFSKSIRVLALTATPGSKVETVQEVIDNLGISHCEIRTEESIDIRQYVHQRNIDQLVLDPSDEMNLVSELFTKALKPLVDKLSSQNIYYGRNPMALTAYGLMQAQKEWFASRSKNVNQGIQFMMRAIFSVLTSIAHSIKLLQFHGIKPFYDIMRDFRSEQEGKGNKGSKYRKQLIEDPSFQEMMDRISGWLKKDDFIGHPKLTALADCVLNHFMDHGETSATRVIVFSEYRDSAEEIVKTLNTHKPLIKASVFVGQADGKRGEGMKQAEQIKTIEKFKKGEINVLVATSIGEEGLDIGQVDLIVCYDSSASPIRMLQRMGRTGRKRAGKIILLLMRGKEEDQFARSKDNYEKMQKLICEGSRFNFRFDLSTRIVPRDIRPEVDKRLIEIPIENTQDSSLPEPKKRRGGAVKKKPPKKFHMPDGVETGFRKVSDFMQPTGRGGQTKPKWNPELDDIEDIPSLEKACLDQRDLQNLNRSYRDLPFNQDVVEETNMPSMASHPELQRWLSPVSAVRHGTRTKSFVRMLRKIATDSSSLVRPCRNNDTSHYLEIPVPPFVGEEGEIKAAGDARTGTGGKQRRPTKAFSSAANQTAPSKNRRAAAKSFITSVVQSTSEEDLEEESDAEELSQSRGRARPRQDGTNAKRKRKQPRQNGGVNSDELGDDCERDSDMLEASDSDDGSDLLDFIVSDNHKLSSTQNPLPTSPTTPTLTQGTPKSAHDRPFYEPTEFQATQDSVDVPDLDALMRGKKRAEPDEPSEDETVSRRAGRARRRLVAESDSDE